MRKKLQQQLSIVEPLIDHDHARELREIDRIIQAHPKILDLIYADLICGLKDPNTGRKGKLSAEQVLKSFIIKQMNGFSYKILNYHLQDSRTYRSFCQFGFADKIPSYKIIQRDIKKLQPETLEAIHHVLMNGAEAKEIEKGRKVRSDCTVVESNIHPPSDSSLLNDSVRVLSRIMQQAKKSFGYAVPNHSRRAKRRALGILNAKNKKARTKLYRDLLKVSCKSVKAAEKVLDDLEQSPPADTVTAMGIASELQEFIPLVKKVIDQTERRVLHGEKVPASEKIFSIFEAHTDIINKDKRDSYYGHKIAVTGGASGLLTDVVIESGNPNDSTLATKMIQRQVDLYGKVPRQAAFDGGFSSKENLKDIKELGVKDVCFSKKCGLKVDEMAKSAWVYKRLRDFRAGIEGMISYLKRCFGLTRCNWSGFSSFKSYVWSSVITANLLLMARRRLA